MKFGSLLFFLFHFWFYPSFFAHSKELHVGLRQIGHKVLLSGGDSTSRVLPIRQHDDTYVISFDKPIHISSDSLYNIVSNELGRLGIRDFVVELKGCASNDVVLAFIYSQSRDTITPCGGRDVPVGCYNIEVTLIKNRDISNWWWVILPVGLLIFMIHFHKRKVISNDNKGKNADQLVTIGTYKFDILNRQLLHISHKEALTEKEAKLLSLLSEGQNEIQNRDYLMNELWADNGILVVSKNLDVLVSKLRKKLSLDENIRITNVHGVGYKLEVNDYL